MNNTHSTIQHTILSCCVALLVVLLSATSAAAWSIKPFRNSTSTGGYNYMFYTPNDAQQKKPLPLIVFLHGASLSGTDLKRVERYGPLDAVHKGMDIPAYILAPQSRGGWDTQRVMKTIKHVQSQCPIDTARIYVIGMSMGGFGTLDMAATFPRFFAAAIGICGGINKPIDGLAEIPLWILHGTADRPVPISHSDRIAARINELNKGERLIYTRLPGINHGQPARLFYRHEMYEWLMEHCLTDVGRPVNRKYTLNNQSIQNAYRNLPGHGRTVR